MQAVHKWIKPVQRGRVGLDIGSGAVKLLGLRAGPSGWTATCAAWTDIIATQDKTAHTAHTLQAIQESIRSTSATNYRYVACGLAGPDAVVRSFSFPSMPPAELEKAVRFEAQQVCPMDMRHSSLDYQLMQPPDGQDSASRKVSGILVAATEQVIQERCRLVREAGVKPALVDAEGLAALNALSELKDMDCYQTIALIDMGRQYTHIVLLGSGGLPFVRDLNSGLQTLIEQICQATGRDAESVRTSLLETAGRSLPDDILVAFHQSVRPLVMSINETLKFYASQEKGVFVEKVHLCGGGALLQPLVDVLSDALPTDVEVFDPFSAIAIDEDIPGAELLKTRGPAFAVAAGLAMRNL